MARTPTNENQATNDATLPLWRVKYSYVVKYQLRNGTYIIPAASGEEAKKKAAQILTDRYADTGPYKVLSATVYA